MENNIVAPSAAPAQPVVQPVVQQINQMPTQAAPSVEYAGFWRRFVALVVDGTVLAIVVVPITVAGALIPQARPLFELFQYLIPVAYFVILESSSLQGTLGKRWMGLRVTDMSGQRISFMRSVGRYFSKIISTIILGIGWLMAGFTAKKQGLHDIITGTLVIKESPTKAWKVVAAFLFQGILVGLVWGAAMGILAHFGGADNSFLPDGLGANPDTMNQDAGNDGSADGASPVSMTSAQYDETLASVSLPSSVADDISSMGDMKNAVSGPFILNAGHVFSSSVMLKIYAPAIANLAADHAVKIVISHVYDDKGTDYLDATSDFETKTFFQEVTMSSYKGSYFSGLRNVNIKKGGLTNQNIKSIEGQIVLSLPLADGSSYSKSYPFTVLAK